ncbi:HDOD domain-containing protein [Desulfohalovibrio reitneri]|uniref:HDOD domain-containing protein n=1 Tax=Desulfohalovibrio reitneri TaxID=1307759 RepID=UPI0004A7673D|nr:HDOD domain-containing protein [Desulfohalovibrio reitneri]
MSKREAVLDKVREVQAMPPAIAKALSLAADPGADLDELARLIEMDPSLTAQLLRVANSGYYAGLRAYSSVREAINRLGSIKVKQILAASGLASRAGREIKGYDMPAGALLEHSVAAALAAERLGTATTGETPVYTFTATLLGDIGKLVLGSFLEVDGQAILELSQEEGIPFQLAEEQVLGVSHPEVGAVLLKDWGLPREIVQIVHWRLSPDDAPFRDKALDLAHCGDCLTKMAGIGLGLDGICYQPAPGAVERLGLTVEDSEMALAELMDDLDELRDALLPTG